MRGYQPGPPHAGHTEDQLAGWERLVADAVGSVIAFWGFKHNQGRLWSLLYLRDTPLSAGQLQDTLGLSKGAVSMLTRELEQWGVIRRTRVVGQGAWHFEAETDLMRMVSRVMAQREHGLVRRVLDDLLDAERDAKRAGNVPPATLERLTRLRRLAQNMDRALDVFMRTARLDFAALGRLLAFEKRGGDHDSADSASEPGDA